MVAGTKCCLFDWLFVSMKCCIYIYVFGRSGGKPMVAHCKNGGRIYTSVALKGLIVLYNVQR